MGVFQSRRLRFLVATFFSFWLLLLFLRGVFYFGFSEVGDTVTPALRVIVDALWVGVRFDFRLAALMTLPLFVFAYLPRRNLATQVSLRAPAKIYYVLAVGVTILAYIIDFGHYAYLGIRVDSTALRFLGDMFISARMVWESYPVIWITLAWLLTLAVSYRLVEAMIRLTLNGPDPELNKKQMTAGIILLLVAGFWGSFGRYSLVPLRWNHAFFSGDTAVASLGLNPVLYFFDTFEFREPPYRMDEVKRYYPDISRYLGVVRHSDAAGHSGMASHHLNYVRYFSVSDHAVVKEGDRPPNVIFIMLESLGASRLGIYGNPLKPSPNLDRIAEEGWFFLNFYVPVSGTSKTVYASVTGLPDVSSVATATRNPLISEQHTIINAFRNHEKYYFIGGSAGWANMGALIKRSIDDLHLFQEGDYSEPVVDVWGISDLSLFREADRRLKKIPRSQPFFAIIQTAANHRPFTVPQDNDGFKKRQVPTEELKKWGFRNVEQFNAVRLLDFNISRFFEMARRSGYFDNTIFVFYGDHNNRITKTPHMAPFYEALDLDGLHVPHMIYSPKYLKPRVIEDAVSLVDVLPTIAGLLGVEYRNSAMGRDINNPFPEEERMVFTQTASKRFPVIGAVTKNLMLRMNYDGSDIKLHDLRSPEPGKDIRLQFPDKADTMSRMARGIYETSKYLHYHNKPADFPSAVR